MVELILTLENRSKGVIKSLLIILILFLFSFFFIYERNDDCSKLAIVGKNSDLITAIDIWHEKLKQQTNILNDGELKKGYLQYSSFRERIDFDWNSLGIDTNELIIKLNGKGVDYSNFQSAHSISIGTNYRTLLIYKMKGSPRFGVDYLTEFSNEITEISEDILLLCR